MWDDQIRLHHQRSRGSPKGGWRRPTSRLGCCNVFDAVLEAVSGMQAGCNVFDAVLEAVSGMHARCNVFDAVPEAVSGMQARCSVFGAVLAAVSGMQARCPPTHCLSLPDLQCCLLGELPELLSLEELA